MNPGLADSSFSLLAAAAVVVAVATQTIEDEKAAFLWPRSFSKKNFWGTPSCVPAGVARRKQSAKRNARTLPALPPLGSSPECQGHVPFSTYEEFPPSLHTGLSEP